MQFFDLVKQSSGIVEFSPNGQFLANGLLHRLIIRDANILQPIETFVCLDAVERLQWSSDSKYILVGMFKRSIIQVWSLEDPSWTCQIDEGSLGFIDVRWSPDGRHILTTAKFHLRITVWSLMNKSVMYMKYPKQGNPGMAFSPNGKHMVLVERRDCKDHISIFVCASWQLVKHFVPETKDIAGVLWSPSGDILCLWEPIPENYKIYLFSLDGNCLSTYSAYQWALGIKTVEWSPTSQFLAVGSYDEKVRLLNHITWRPITEYTHSPCVTSLDTIVYKEVESDSTAFEHCFLSESISQPKSSISYVIEESRPIDIPSLTADSMKANPKQGIGILRFSPDGRFIYSISDSMPTALWIWDLDKLEVTDILIQRKPIKSVAWSPVESRLALCTGEGYVHFWFAGKSTSIKVPHDSPVAIQNLLWHPVGKSLLLINKENMCLCSLDV